MLHTPGHTQGSISLWMPGEGKLVAGDTLFRDSIGRTDLPGGDWQADSAVDPRQAAAAAGETLVIPGHGENTTIGREKAVQLLSAGIGSDAGDTYPGRDSAARARRGRGASRFIWASPGPARCCCAWRRAASATRTCSCAGLEKLPLAPVTLGHEGIGRVEAVGAGVTRVGGRAIARASRFWGRPAEAASGAARAASGSAQADEFRIHAARRAGGVRDRARRRRWCACRRDLPAEVAAPLCCAGWTAYGALREAGLERGQTVALFGYGGLGHLALQMARHQGLRVAVADPSRSEDGAQLARDRGRETPDDAAEARRRGCGDRVHALPRRPSSRPSARCAGTARWCWWGLRRPRTNCRWWTRCSRASRSAAAIWGRAQDLAAVFELARAGVLRAARADSRPGGDAGAAGEAAARRDCGPGGDSVLSGARAV